VQLTIEHGFPLPSCEAFEAVFFDEDFNIALGAALQMGRRLKRFDRTPQRIVRHVVYEPKHAAGSPAESIGTSLRAFVEELDYDVLAHRGTWRTVPNAFADRFRNTGTLEVVMRGAEVHRIVRAEISVRLFGLGGRVERIVAAEIEKSYERSTSFMLEWLRGKR
jgi:hypothetical protein